MRHISFTQQPSYAVAILIKESSMNEGSMLQHYVTPAVQQGLALESFYAISLAYNGKKLPVSLCKEYLGMILPTIKQLGTKTILCADSGYFKALTKKANPDSCIGYAVPCTIVGYEDLSVIYTINYSALVYNPDQASKIVTSVKTLVLHLANTLVTLGSDIIHHAEYPSTNKAVGEALTRLHKHPELTVDIEAFSLQLQKAKVGTCSFAWDKHSGMAFLCDYRPCEEQSGIFGYCHPNKPVRALLKQFLETYQGKLIAHNSNYDFKVLIHELFMEHPLDTVGMLKGIETLTRLFEDTKLIAYLALNSTADVSLSLKSLAQPYAGNYANSEIKDIRKIPPMDLLKYNLTDCLSTWYVYEQLKPVMVNDNQEVLYETMFKPYVKVILQMELVGMPLVPERVLASETKLLTIINEAKDHVLNHALTQEALLLLKQRRVILDNVKLKTKVRTLDDLIKMEFSLSSDAHLRVLLFDVIKLPVLETTDTGLASVSYEQLKSLINHATDSEHIGLINSINLWKKADKILNTFIKVFKEATPKADGRNYLHGNFNLGGTVSGRLSSSGPNLQTIPSSSEHAKLIKQCFVAPKGYILVYADFSS
jgi:DNA polymerase-1